MGSTSIDRPLPRLYRAHSDMLYGGRRAFQIADRIGEVARAYDVSPLRQHRLTTRQARNRRLRRRRLARGQLEDLAPAPNYRLLPKTATTSRNCAGRASTVLAVTVHDRSQPCRRPARLCQEVGHACCQRCQGRTRPGTDGCETLLPNRRLSRVCKPYSLSRFITVLADINSSRDPGRRARSAAPSCATWHTISPQALGRGANADVDSGPYGGLRIRKTWARSCNLSRSLAVPTACPMRHRRYAGSRRMRFEARTQIATSLSCRSTSPEKTVRCRLGFVSAI